MQEEAKAAYYAHDDFGSKAAAEALSKASVAAVDAAVDVSLQEATYFPMQCTRSTRRVNLVLTIVLLAVFRCCTAWESRWLPTGNGGHSCTRLPLVTLLARKGQPGEQLYQLRPYHHIRVGRPGMDELHEGTPLRFVALVSARTKQQQHNGNRQL